MRFNRIPKLIAIALVFSLLAVAVPASPAFGAYGTIEFTSPSSGPAGSGVSIHGYGFTAGVSYYVTFNNNTVGSPGTITAGGEFYTSFNVPQLAGSSYYIRAYVTGDTNNYLLFTVTPEITLNTTSGNVGDTIFLSGRGFYASSTVSIYFDNTALSTSITASSDGTFTSGSFVVPAAAKGNHLVKGKDTSAYSPVVNFNVLSKIAVSPLSGGVSDQVSVTGTGFAASRNVVFYWDNTIVTTESITTDTSGGFTISTFTIPPTSRGNHTIKAQDASGNNSTVLFAVAQKITASPLTGIPGTVVTITGNGFQASKAITVSYNNTPVITAPTPVLTNTSGSFSATFTVPAGFPGTFAITATDGMDTSTTDFTATTDAKISEETTAATPGYVGMEVTISGTGFKPSTEVTIYYATNPIVLTTTTTDASGAFSVTVIIPPSAGGDHTITATDGTTIKSFPFYMEKALPLIPQPLLPLDESKAKALVEFDWEDVTDPSGVTYILQIATDKDFSEIVLEKTDLTVSGYTLDEGEKLPSNKKSAPYYWRIKAIDGAANESGWTTPGTFNVGFSLELANWMLYILMGLGGILLFLVGFFLGRRSAMTF
ncbi:MAG: hypothetical protein ABIB93_06025 [Chloroflexota bacterium]